MHGPRVLRENLPEEKRFVCASSSLERVAQKITPPLSRPIIGDRWWPLFVEAKKAGDKICKKCLCKVWQKRKERQNVDGACLK